MSEELFKKIKQHVNEALDESILVKITKIEYANFDGYQVIQVFIKDGTKVKEMATIMKTIENYAKNHNYSVVVDFLKGIPTKKL